MLEDLRLVSEYQGFSWQDLRLRVAWQDLRFQARGLHVVCFPYVILEKRKMSDMPAASCLICVASARYSFEKYCLFFFVFLVGFPGRADLMYP